MGVTLRPSHCTVSLDMAAYSHSAAQCRLTTHSLPTLLLLLLLTAELGAGAPRAESSYSDMAGLRNHGGQGGGGLGLGKGWGLQGLDLGTDRQRGQSEVDHMLQGILSKNNTPAVRMLFNDHLFLYHLKLYLQRPTGRHLRQLENRAKTLRRRRTDEVSSRFFLRD